jgi:hypothetical protein
MPHWIHGHHAIPLDKHREVTDNVTPLNSIMGSHSSSLQVFEQVPIGGIVARKGLFKNTFAIKTSSTEVVCLNSLNLCTCVHISDFLSCRFCSIDIEKTRRANEVGGNDFTASQHRAQNARRKQIRMSSDESFVLYCHLKNPFGNRRTQNPFSLKDKLRSWTVFNFPLNRPREPLC